MAIDEAKLRGVIEHLVDQGLNWVSETDRENYKKEVVGPAFGDDSEKETTSEEAEEEKDEDKTETNPSSTSSRATTRR